MKSTTIAMASAIVCTAVSLGIGSALAQDIKSSAPLDQLSEFVGDGTCSGHVMAMGKAPAHATTGKYHGEKTLDGHWIVIHYDEDQTAANPKPFHLQQFFGYDAAKKRYVAVLFENSNETYATGTSQGWKGDTATFDESMGGESGMFRDVFTRGASGMASHAGWMKDKSGKWVKTDEENCKPS